MTTTTTRYILGSVLAVGLATGSGLAGQTAHEQHRPHGQDVDARHMEHSFDDAERYARSFDDPARDAWQQPERVIEMLAIQPDEAVADIGAGTGYFTVRLAGGSAARTVYAVDVEESMLAYVRARAEREGLDHVVAVQGDAQGPNLPEPVDVVLIVNTFHHIPDRAQYFAALKERLNPGARLAIVDYAKGAAGGGPPDEFRFTPEEITNQLRRAGFTLRATHDFLARQSFLVFGVGE